MKWNQYLIATGIVALSLTSATGCGKKTAPAYDSSREIEGEEFQISDEERRRVLQELGVAEDQIAGGDIDPTKRMTEAEREAARQRQRERQAQRGEPAPDSTPAAPAPGQAVAVAPAKPAEPAKPAVPTAPAASGRGMTPEGRTANRACKQCEFYLNEKDLTLAMQRADALVQQFPQMAEGYIARAIIYRRQGKLEDAELELRRALGFDKDHEWATVYLATLLRDQGRLKPAIWILEEHRKKFPNSLPALYSLGILYELYAGAYAKALVTYVDYLRKGGPRQKEVNVWIDALSIRLGVERPDTPGMYVAPPPKPAEPATPADGEASPEVPAPASPGPAPSAPTPDPAPQAS